MKQYAIQHGVPDADIVLDYAGRRTYDTCYRAGYIFEVKEAILETQWLAFGLKGGPNTTRAGFGMHSAYACDKLGIDAVGVAADRRSYVMARFWWVREVAAVSRAWLDLNLLHPMPVLGEKLPIL
jgi:SanA protein